MWEEQQMVDLDGWSSVDTNELMEAHRSDNLINCAELELF